MRSTSTSSERRQQHAGLRATSSYRAAGAVGHWWEHTAHVRRGEAEGKQMPPPGARPDCWRNPASRTGAAAVAATGASERGSVAAALPAAAAALTVSGAPVPAVPAVAAVGTRWIRRAGMQAGACVSQNITFLFVAVGGFTVRSSGAI